MTQKIVINGCYGGFGLSYKAVMRYAELKGIKLYAYVNQRINGKLDFDKYVEYKIGDKAYIIYYTNKKIKSKDELTDGVYFSYRDIDRDDKVLVKVVKELGKEASGGCAELKVAEIPDGVEWTIEEYDGIEWVAEKHRIWD